MSRLVLKTGAEIMEEREKAGKADACENAVMAAMEVLSESCGGKVVRIPGIGMVQVPREVLEATKELPTREARIKIIAKTPWALELARGVLAFAGVERIQAGIDAMAMRIAEAIVE